MEGTRDRKKLMENALMLRALVQLSESGGDNYHHVVVVFLVPHYDLVSSCILDGLQALDLRFWQSSWETILQ